MSEKIIQFAYRETVPPESRTPNNMPGRTQIFAKLRQRELVPMVSAHAEMAFWTDGVELGVVTADGEASHATGIVAHEAVALIVNRIGRSLKLDELPKSLTLPPVINENQTRSLAHHKIRAHQEVLHPLGIAIPTALPRSPEQLAAFLEEYAATKFVVKPSSGSGGEGVQRVERDNVAAMFTDGAVNWGEYLLQVAYDFSRPFPATLRPYDAASREAFEGWSASSTPKELRVYGFHSPDGTEVFPVGRALQDGDHWFFVDPETVPAEVLDTTRQAIARAAAVSGAAAVFGTIDYGFAVGYGHSEPGWHAIELNGRSPYMLGYDKHHQVADHIRELFADQILATATT